MDSPTQAGQVYAGPWLGMEERETYQTPQHCELAINVDLSRGYIEPRRPIKALGTTNIIRPQIFVAQRAGGTPRVIHVGFYIGATAFNPCVWIGDTSGNQIAFIDLTATFGEPPSEKFRVSFVRTSLKSGKYAVLIVGPTQTYIWSPLDDETTLRRPVLSTGAGGDMQKQNAINFAYVNQVMRGPIAESHQARVVYAGFDEQHVLSADTTLPADQQDAYGSLLTVHRDGIVVGPNVLAISDQVAPFDIQIASLIVLGFDERVVGVRSFREQLVIVTDKALYAMSGDIDHYNVTSSSLVKVVSGVGGVSHGSITEANGLLYYQAVDGIYQFDGVTCTKLSKGIDSLWNGRRHNARLNPTADAILSTQTHAWPWQVDGTMQGVSSAAHYQTANQVWFFIPVKSRVWPAITGTPLPPWFCRFSIAVVYDYIHKAFTYYVTSSQYDSLSAGASWYDNGTERMYVGLNYFMCEYGLAVIGDSSNGPFSPPLAYPLIYVTGRIAKENLEQIDWRNLTVTMLAVGKTPAASPPQIAIDGEQAPFDGQINAATNTTRQQYAGTLETHPYGMANATLAPRNNAYFLGTGTLGHTMLLSAQTWFAQKVFTSKIESKFVRIAFVDNPTAARTPWITVQSFGFEQTGTGVVRAL